MNKTDLAFTPALEQAQLIRKRQISPLDLVELYLDRLVNLDRPLGSFFSIAGETAMADAQRKTEQLSQTKDTSELPPFFGVPIGIKDLNSVMGMPCSYGSSILKDNLANYDDAIVTRIKEAGFIILGKTATSEVGSLPYTEAQGFPPTRNPWHLDYTPGGSSGGSAAAVAAGLCAIAQGSDGGGSIRGPAFCCGLVGIKPSRGRVSYSPVGDHQSGISVNGPIARSVADAAALLDLMSGYVTGDPYWLPDPPISFLQSSRQVPKPLRIAFATSILPFGEAALPCRQAVENIVQLMADLGHNVEPACPNFGPLVEPFTKVWQAGVAASGIPAEALSPMNRWILEQSGSAGEYLQAVRQMQLFARQIVGLFDGFDVLLLPTYMHPTIRVGEWSDLSPEETLERIINWVLPCPPFNASGNPAIALPTGFDSNGLPVGVQLVGKPADEITLISLAAQLEAVLPCKNNRPTFASL